MGLDITAYRQIKLAADQHEGDPEFDYWEAGEFRPYHNTAFPGRADDIKDNGYYTAAEEFGFRAGSYGGYNEWREQLAKFAGYAAAPAEHRQGTLRHDQGAWNASDGAFWELISYSDCEGVIGAAVSAKLAKDFADNQARADAYDGWDADWFKSRYADWRKAFEMAADGGCVVFH